jgi:hypothetical protein
MAEQSLSMDVGERLKHFVNITPQAFAHEQQLLYKAWPSYPGRYIVAHYLILHPDTFTGDTLPITIEVIDERGGQFVRGASGIYSFVLDRGFTRPQLRSIDTARYELKPGMISFGLNTDAQRDAQERHVRQRGRPERVTATDRCARARDGYRIMTVGLAGAVGDAMPLPAESL